MPPTSVSFWGYKSVAPVALKRGLEARLGFVARMEV